MDARRDLAPALGLAVLGVAGLLIEPASPDGLVTREWDALAIGLALAMTLPLAARRARPLAVAALVVAATLTGTALGYGTGLAELGMLVALASAAYHTSRAVTIRLGAIAGVLVVGALAASPSEAIASFGAVAGGAASVLLALLSGDLLRETRHAERRAAVVEERARIAREVHDVVGHALAGITLQARAGARRPARAAEALEQIDALASTALAETRQAVGIIRGDEQRAALVPQPSLDDLDELVAAVRAPELRVDVRRDALDGDVPPGVQRAAYRVVQESLSNAARHARPASVVVSLRREPDALAVEVRDDGRQAPRSNRGGHGLQGMRERVEQVGGSLEAGPLAEGGWAVRARLPL